MLVGRAVPAGQACVQEGTRGGADATLLGFRATPSNAQGPLTALFFFCNLSTWRAGATLSSLLLPLQTWVILGGLGCTCQEPASLCR